jgi:hypothetical protein
MMSSHVNELHIRSAQPAQESLSGLAMRVNAMFDADQQEQGRLYYTFMQAAK